jgi:hypothetical protein
MTSTPIIAPVRIIQSRAYPIRVGAVVYYDGIAHEVTAVERNATVLRIVPVGQYSGSVWITV